MYMIVLHVVNCNFIELICLNESNDGNVFKLNSINLVYMCIRIKIVYFASYSNSKQDENRGAYILTPQFVCVMSHRKIVQLTSLYSVEN
jgi:hypothetical protein